MNWIKTSLLGVALVIFIVFITPAKSSNPGKIRPCDSVECPGGKYCVNVEEYNDEIGHSAAGPFCLDIPFGDPLTCHGPNHLKCEPDKKCIMRRITCDSEIEPCLSSAAMCVIKDKDSNPNCDPHRSCIGILCIIGTTCIETDCGFECVPNNPPTEKPYYYY